MGQKVAVLRRICCSSEQIVCLFGDGDANAAQGQAIDGIAWVFGGSPATLYNGHRWHRGMSVDSAKGLKTLKGENAGLECLVADQMLRA